MSAAEDDAVPRPVRVAAVRAALFLGFWLMISGRNVNDLPVGLAAVAAATWISLRLLPAGGIVVAARVAHSARSALRTSVGRFGNGGCVARAQSEVTTASRLRRLFFAPAVGRSAERVCALSSLLPGTLPTGTDEYGALLVHCLDTGQPVIANLAEEETLFIRALGHD